MTHRLIATTLIPTTFLATALAAAVVATGTAADVVELRMQGRYFGAPATIRIIVVVEPNDSNRSLRVELDGDQMFRASVLTLEGASAKRVHELFLREVPAGQYTVRAEVLSTDTVRGMASRALDVVGWP